MAFDYAKIAATAARLIENFGQTISVTRTTGATIDPVTGAAVAGTDTVYSPKGILKKYPDDVIDGTRIETGDRELILDNTIEPDLSDKVTVQGEQWTIVNVTSVNPAGTAIVFFCQVRK